jgi:hypothetical protein
MPESLGEVVATRKQSIARVELFTDAVRPPDDWLLRIHFEDGLYEPGGALIANTSQFGTRVVERRFGEIKAVPLTAAGATVTVEQLAALIAAGAYAFRAEDIAAAEGEG